MFVIKIFISENDSTVQQLMIIAPHNLCVAITKTNEYTNY